MQIRKMLNQLLVSFFKGEDIYNSNQADTHGMDHKILDLSISFWAHWICIYI